MQNPILNQGPLPNFSAIEPQQIEPTLKHIISQNRSELTDLLNNNSNFTWNNLMQPMEEMGNKLSNMWSPVSHVHSVLESEPLRTAYNACLPLLTEYSTEIMQNEALYKATKAIAEGPEYKKLNTAQRKVIDNDLRDFKLAGVSLPPKEKARFAELQKQLSKLTTKFSENLLDATSAWTLNMTDRKALAGLPETALAIAQNNAEERHEKGWTFTLDFPSYSSVMKYLANREIRQRMYEAYVTRASDQGPHAGKWDNTQIMEDILKARHELALLVGYTNFADYALATKMADSSQRVLTFLYDLAKRAKHFALEEIRELTQLAKSTDGIDHLEAWDISFYTEKLRQKKFSLAQEDLRPYFPIDKVLVGMFTVMQNLFGIKIIERHDVNTWHPNVRFFEVRDENNELRGSFYTDLYARPNKRDGAWMNDCRCRYLKADGNMQYPVAFLTCNFTRPLDNKPALLTHDDVLTLFHEFGHTLHHLLTKVDYSAVSGLNGVPWDAVEFPSQFLEFWCWDKKTLSLISSHHETGEPLPETLYKKLIATKNFQAGMHISRQLEFALFDFRLHLEYDPKKNTRAQAMLDEVRKEISVVNTPRFNRFQHSFSHIFAGGYAAGYYSYEWAEVLSSDAFSLFEEKGIFDRATGRSFLENILQMGGVKNPMELFIAFRGREPTVDALLRHSGLT